MIRYRTPPHLHLTGLLCLTLLAACGDKEPEATATTAQTTEATAESASEGDSDSDSSTGGPDSDSASASASASASGSTTTGGGDSDSDTDTDGCSFIDCNDGGGEGTGECDYWAQDCPDDEKCTFWANDGGSAWNATKCTQIDPNAVQPGDICNTGGAGAVSGEDNCDHGSMCWNIDSETDEGVCAAFCTGSEESPSCAPGFSCALANVILCLPNCDPLLQDCPGGDLCLPSGDGWICVLDASGGEGTYGVPCEYANACNPGLLCIDPNYVEDCPAAGCCTPFCDIQEPNTCPGGTQECLPWYEEGMAPPGYENVGVCGIPQ